MRGPLDPDLCARGCGVEADAVAEGLWGRVVLLPGGVVGDIADLCDGVGGGEGRARGEGDLVLELGPLALPEPLGAVLGLGDQEPDVAVVVLGAEVHQDVHDVVLDEDALLVFRVLGTLPQAAPRLETPECQRNLNLLAWYVLVRNLLPTGRKHVGGNTLSGRPFLVLHSF